MIVKWFVHGLSPKEEEKSERDKYMEGRILKKMGGEQKVSPLKKTEIGLEDRDRCFDYFVFWYSCGNIQDGFNHIQKKTDRIAGW